MFDSWDIAPTIIAHLVNQGIVDFYLVDHRSSENRLDTFLREVPVTARIHWIRKGSALHSQSPTMTALAHLARQDGFAAFVPFDSDEFFTSTSGSLVNDIREWLATSDSRALSCLMENFYQSRSVDNFTTSTLAEVHYRAEQGAVPDEHFTDVNRLFARYRYYRSPHKSIMRLVPGPDGDFDWLGTGSHNVVNVSTDEKYTPSYSKNISVLHLPNRSRYGLLGRRAIRLRALDNTGTSLDTAGTEFTLVEAERDAEWRRASVPDDTVAERIVVEGVNAVRDERISELCTSLVREVRHPTSAPVPYIDETSRMADTALDLAQPMVQLAHRVAGRDYVPIEMRNVHQLERRLSKLQAQLAIQRPNLLRIVLDRIRRR